MPPLSAEDSIVHIEIFYRQARELHLRRGYLPQKSLGDVLRRLACEETRAAQMEEFEVWIQRFTFDSDEREHYHEKHKLIRISGLFPMQFPSGNPPFLIPPPLGVEYRRYQRANHPHPEQIVHSTGCSKFDNEQLRTMYYMIRQIKPVDFFQEAKLHRTLPRLSPHHSSETIGDLCPEIHADPDGSVECGGCNATTYLLGAFLKLRSTPGIAGVVTTETGAYVSDNLVGRIEQYYKDEQPLFQDIVRRSSTMISLQGIEEMHIKLKAEALEHIGHKQQVCDELHRLVMPRWTVRLEQELGGQEPRHMALIPDALRYLPPARRVALRRARSESASTSSSSGEDSVKDDYDTKGHAVKRRKGDIKVEKKEKD